MKMTCNVFLTILALGHALDETCTSTDKTCTSGETDEELYLLQSQAKLHVASQNKDNGNREVQVEGEEWEVERAHSLKRNNEEKWKEIMKRGKDGELEEAVEEGEVEESQEDVGLMSSERDHLKARSNGTSLQKLGLDTETIEINIFFCSHSPSQQWAFYKWPKYCDSTACSEQKIRVSPKPYSTEVDEDYHGCTLRLTYMAYNQKINLGKDASSGAFDGEWISIWSKTGDAGWIDYISMRHLTRAGGMMESGVDYMTGQVGDSGWCFSTDSGDSGYWSSAPVCYSKLRFSPYGDQGGDMRGTEAR